MASFEMPAGTDLSDTKQPAIYAVNLVGYVLSFVAVALRLIARRMSNAPIWWDDWLIVGALLVSTIFLFMNLTWLVAHGLGKHIWATDDLAEAIFAFDLGLFIQELAYTTIIVLVKYSLLCFYWRIFAGNRSIRLPIFILGGVITCWGIALWFVTIFQCIPVQGFWDKTIESSCNVNVTSFFFGNSIPNIITDVAIMILPVPYIWRLHLLKAQKIALLSIFAVGIFVVVISCTRLAFVLHLDLVNIDITWNFNQTDIWTTLEVYVAIVCACLPSHKPIISLIFTRAFTSRKTTHNSSSNPKLVSSNNRSGTWANLKNSMNGEKTLQSDEESRPFKLLPAHVETKRNVKVMARVSTHEGGSHRDSDVELADMQGVQVTTDFEVRWHKSGS